MILDELDVSKRLQFEIADPERLRIPVNLQSADIIRTQSSPLCLGKRRHLFRTQPDQITAQQIKRMRIQ